MFLIFSDVPDSILIMLDVCGIFVVPEKMWSVGSFFPPFATVNLNVLCINTPLLTLLISSATAV